MIWRRFIRSIVDAAGSAAPPGADAVEPALVRYVDRAVQAFGTPIALVSLLHDDEQFMIASRGMPFRCMPRQEGFCRYAVARGDLFEVCDARSDPRFASLSAVTGAPGVRYYLGAPFGLTGAGDIGALCVVDVEPRRPASVDERAYLRTLARQVSAVLERRLGIDRDLAA